MEKVVPYSRQEWWRQLLQQQMHGSVINSSNRSEPLQAPGYKDPPGFPINPLISPLLSTCLAQTQLSGAIGVIGNAKTDTCLMDRPNIPT